ncbi:MAG: YeeE/YedE family protein, partial [Acidobacteria bacterium]|nr:YeeE/YedE family protein [Acidobacteriota bacterium]
IAMALGINVAQWPYWAAPAQAAALKASVLTDVPSVMNAGIILGALAAASAAGRFAPAWRVPLRSLAAAIVGGLMLGYGARIAYGCNIGAYFSGIASGSVHGWVWLPSAFVGNVLGTSLRPMFGLRK